MAVVSGDPITIDTAPEVEPDTAAYTLSAPILTALPGDGFAIAWSLHHPSVGGHSAESETFISFYDSDADTTVAPLIELPGGALGNIAASTAGTVAVLMGGSGPVPITAQLFDLNGNPIADEQVIFDPDSDAIYTAPVSLLATTDGGYAAAWFWTHDSTNNTVFSSQLRLIGPDGEAAPNAIDIGEDAASRVATAIAADGEIKVLAGDSLGGGRLLYRFSEDGELLAEPELLSSGFGDRLANGDMIVVGSIPYAIQPPPGPAPLFVQRLDSDGDPISDKIVIGVATDIAPQIAPLQNGGYVVAWSADTSGFGSPKEVRYQVFDRDDVVVASGSVDDESNTGGFDIATLDDGRFVITYAHETDGEDPVPAISAQVFDHEPSRTATPGGTIAVAETWQDQLAIARGDGIDTLVTSDSLALAPFIPNLTMAGIADLNAGGNDMANFMVGNAGDNIIVGYLGNDVMHGHGGADFLAMGRGNDVADTGDGQNTVWGGQGDDSIQGGTGDDILNGDRHDDVIDGGDGDDSINGGSHDDLLTGADGEDSLTGGTGADTLEGGDGADTLRGDRDDDRLEGGDGPDSFVFAHFFGNDTILDFHWAEDDRDSDRIVIEVDEDSTINGVLIEDVAGILDLADDTDDGLSIAIGTGHAILLEGVEKADLTEDAFALVVL
ncbi:hypothetical protein STVA_20020 [Allostella vacuolata]|nr:hypothetical protein STVA_20020 [Stella vacuolata]